MFYDFTNLKLNRISSVYSVIELEKIIINDNRQNFFPYENKFTESSDNFPLPFYHLSHQFERKRKMGSDKESGTL